MPGQIQQFFYPGGLDCNTLNTLKGDLRVVVVASNVVVCAQDNIDFEKSTSYQAKYFPNYFSGQNSRLLVLRLS